MTKLINILEKIESHNTQSLFCELPQNMVDSLKIASDGTVDLEALLTICLRVTKAESDKKQMMDLIYNSSIAADFQHRKSA